MSYRIRNPSVSAVIFVPINKKLNPVNFYCLVSLWKEESEVDYLFIHRKINAHFFPTAPLLYPARLFDRYPENVLVPLLSTAMLL